MKKKIFSILLSLAMVITMMPAMTLTSFATEDPDYFCITNTSGEDATVTWTKENNPNQINLKYKIGSGDWSASAIEFVSEASSIALPAGQSIYFKNNTGKFNSFTNSPSFGLVGYSVMCNKAHNVSGDITTLLSESGNVTDLTSAGTYTFFNLFKGDTNLISAENLMLPSTTLMQWCYRGLFYGCTGLTKAPQLPALEMAKSCYLDMFSGCTALTTSPALPAMTLAEGCYSSMFEYSGLTTAPALPAQQLKKECYQQMFADTKLATAPILNSTGLAESCYAYMFRGCDNLVAAPALPALQMKEECYRGLFMNCKALVTAPVLPATTLANQCYALMFYGCEKLKALHVSFTATGAAVNPLAYSGYDAYGWLVNTASGDSGILYVPETNSMSAEALMLPSNWTIKKETSDWSKLALAIAGESNDSVKNVFEIDDKTIASTRKITLLDDITAKSNDPALIVPSGESIVLDLNGHVLDRGLVNADGTVTRNDHGSAIEVSGGSLTIEDSASTKVHNGYLDNNGLWHLAAAEHPTVGETAYTIEGGIITGGTGYYKNNYYYGGAIYIDYGLVNLKKGNIAGNTSIWGGGIYCNNYTDKTATFKMTNGSIIANRACGNGQGRGGALSITGKAIIEGGVITRNTTDNNGGAIQSSYGDFLMTGGTISYNSSEKYAGAFQNGGYSSLKADPGKEIKIVNNTAGIAEGGIANWEELKLSGKVIIKDNTCNGTYTDTGFDYYYPSNLATGYPVIIDGALTGSEIYLTYASSSTDKHDAGVLTTGYTTSSNATNINDFFHYDGPNTYYMFKNASGELEVASVPSGSYAISIPSIKNGKVTADKQIASAGATVTLTVTPDEGYELESLKYNDGTDHDITSTKSFTMPAKAVTVTATFKEKSGGGGETDPSTPTEEYTVPVEGEGSVQIETSITDGTAEVKEITKEALEEVAKPKEGQATTDTIVIDLSNAKQEVKGVVLTKPTVENLADVTASKDNDITCVEIALTKASVTLDSKALNAINEQANGDTIQLVIDDTKTDNLNKAQQSALNDYEVSSTFEAYFESNGQRIHDFKGGVATVSMKFEPAKGKNANNYKVYYIAETGKMTKYATKFVDGLLKFATTHFSDYAIVYDPSVDVLLLQAKTSGSKAVKLSWNGIDNASKYVVYGAKCGKNYKKLKTTNGKSYTVKKIAGKKLKAHKAYKFYVVGYDAVGNKVQSKSIHFVTANTQGKYANVKSIKAKYNELLLSTGVTQKIGAKYKMYSGKKHLKKGHGQALRYVSTNSEIATVTSSGTVKAVGKGTATIYIQDIGGKYCKTKVTVE